MTRIQAQMELRRLHEKNLATGLPLVLDTDEMLVFLPEEEEHRDYIFWRAVETEGGDWAVEQCVDPQTGTCSVTRVWLTPKERMERSKDPA